ncbi:MAG: hsp70 family protein [Deltaproteobacteria bacterium]|nr:hsp70 family protein [Deltaproteobacteria bacterium]
MTARYVVGVDLGTTNTVVSYVDLGVAPSGARTAEVFPIEQLVSAGTTEARRLLPSALFASAESGAAWSIGEHARARGAEVPGRYVSSAKSWLAHAGVDRTAPILPWGVDEEGTPKISPVDASAAVLCHVREAWDRAHPDAPLAKQDVVVTVPASFDEAARAYTVEAIRAAGLPDQRVRLLEEPQAAFLDWARIVSEKGGEAGLSAIAPERGAREVLVIDVGGGTSDFSLMRVTRDPTSPMGVRVDRVAVGDHLLLGGDNIDLAIAHLLEPRLVAPTDRSTHEGQGERLPPARFAQLVLAARAAKETLLSRESTATETPVTLLGQGSRLIGGARKTMLARAELEAILDGFFPVVTPESRPARTRAGLVAFGLPFASDPAVTRHLAQFLARHASGASLAVLLNGGAFHASAIVERVVAAVTALTGSRPEVLAQGDPDLSVARGAALYALSLRGEGLRIGGGSARSYWIGLDVDERGKRRAVCVVPRGAPTAAWQIVEGRTFGLVVGRTARFDLFASSGAAGQVDRVGDVSTIDDETFVLLPPIVAAVGRGSSGARELAVRLEGQLTEVGTLDLECVEADAPPGRPPRKFRLGFEIRKDTDVAPTSLRGRSARAAEDPRLAEARAKIESAFAKDSDPREAKNLMRELERILGDRAAWPINVVRPLFDALRPGVPGRRRTADHERMFFQLAGFLLRPGYGDPLDGQRVAAIVPLWEQRLAFANETNGWRAFWIAWRRIAGGLGESGQLKIRDTLDPFLDEANKGRKKPKGVRAEPLDEVLFLASVLERVPVERRAELGAWLLEKTWTSRDPAVYAALGRVGARVPAYASVHHVVPARTAQGWLEQVLKADWREIPTAPFAAVQLARVTGDRARDVSDALRADVQKKLERFAARPAWIAMVRDLVPVDDQQRSEVFGETLPPGLRLVEN